MLFVLTNLLLILFVWRALPLVTPEGGPWTRAMTGFLLAMSVATGIPLVLGLVGFLVPVAQLVAIGVLVVGVFVAERRIAGVPAPPVERVDSGWTVVSGALLGASLGVWFGRPGWSGTGFCFDDIVYHASVASYWLQFGEISYAPFNYQTYYAFNSELLSLWFMLSSGGLEHAGLAVLLFVALVVCGTLSIGETHEVPVPATLGTLAALFASHRMLYFARTFSSTDLAMAAYVVAALAFALRPPTLRTAVWCGLAGGLAIGTKISAVPGLALVGLLWLWRARGGRISLPLVFTTLLGVFGSYWYLRNLVHTGNPLFPATIGPFEGPLTPSAARRTTVLHFIEKRGHRSSFWIELVRDRLAFPEFLGWSAVVGYPLGLLGGWLNKDRRGAWLIVAVGLLFFVLFPMQPFSGTVNRPNTPLHNMVRYLTLFLVLGLPLLGTVVRRGDFLSRVLTALSWAGFAGCVYVATESTYGSADVLWLLAGASFGLVVLGLVGSAPVGTVPAILAAALLAIAVRTPQKIEYTRERVIRFSPIGRLHGNAWRALEESAPDGTYVAWLSDMPTSHAFNVPLMGSRLQYKIVPVDRHGRRQDLLLHERWRDDPEDWWWEFKDRPGSGVPVVENLLRSGAEMLVVSRCHRSTKGGWPRPHATLVGSALAARVYRDRCVEIWDLEAVRGSDLVEPARKPRKPKPKPKKKSKNKAREKGVDAGGETPPRPRRKEKTRP